LKIIPIIRTVHGFTGVPKNLSINQNLRSSLVVFLDRFLIAHGADSVIAVSKDMEQQLKNNGVKGEVLQLNNTIDLTDYHFMHRPEEVRAQYGVGNLFWIGTAARLAEPKNLPMLIETGARLRKEKVPFRISIFGEGPLRESLQNLINTHSLERHIVLHGFTNKIPDILRGLDVFVLCSVQEGLPMALLEAMALGKPVVCTAVGGMKEVIEDGYNGILIPSQDTASFVSALLSIYNKKEMATIMGKSASDHILKNYSVADASEKLYNAYSRITHKN